MQNPEPGNEDVPDLWDVRQIIGRAWPIGGPYTSEAIVAAADAVGELIRYLNHATFDSSVLNGPSLAAVLLALNDAEDRRTQLYRQLEIVAVQLTQDPTLYDDREEDPRDALARISRELLHARSSAESHRIALGRASGAASHLGHRDD